MKISVKAVCSECQTTQFVDLTYEQKEIQCLACGHTLPNLAENELNEIEMSLKRQRTNNIIALVCFVVAVAGFYHWVTTTSSTGGWTLSSDDENRLMISLAITVIGFLGTLIFGALGALKRYVVEF